MEFWLRLNKSFSVVLYYSLLLSGLLLSCGGQQAGADLAPEVQEQKVYTLSDHGGEPRLYTDDLGRVYISWIETVDSSTHSLLFSSWQDTSWGAPVLIATGDNWFVNWADFPSLVVYGSDQQYLAAHWLQKRAAGTYDYDIHISQSLDGGSDWSPSFLLHNDDIAAEHGFVSLLPLAEDRIFATWLDGRNTKSEPGESDHGHGHHGSMSLRAATFNTQGDLSDEAELDTRVCDCCQTSAAMTSNGPIVAYRDRSETEIRDISVVRQLDGEWLSPQTVHADNWQIEGCPVNGPVIRARGAQVAVAWFTMQGDTSLVKLAFSKDGGKTFDEPVRVDYGQALGRIGLEFVADDEVVVSWMEQTEEASKIEMSRYQIGGAKLASQQLANSSSSRQSGFPVLAVSNNYLFYAWTDVSGATARVQSGRLPL